MKKQDYKILVFVSLAFLFTVPTWFSGLYASDDMAWFVWDICTLLRISLLPLMAYALAKNKILKTVFILYFFLTLFNVSNYLLVSFEIIGVNYIVFQILGAGTIAFYLIYKMWKSEEVFYA